MWSWLEPLGKMLYDLRWPLLLYFGGLLVCYMMIDSIQYWVRELRRARSEARFRRMGLEDIDQMDHRAFLRYLTFLFECAGFTVLPTPPAGNYGVDLVLVHPSGEEWIAVQAIRSAEPVDGGPVCQLAAAKGLYQCGRAMAVTSAEFTDEARQEAEVQGVTLVDRTKLQEFMALSLPPAAEVAVGSR
ncbi:restriction system protein [Symbiobacterium terraclitae]|uniref:Restriction system protein n=1 Tax=Symbiobacterium terraclitae TaxID=557451 RepID=A0ABS4JTN1_9FIRM|nr:restriction system protein [Symbiobacterium terraclitae]